jgi:hypothetical protein
MSIEDELLQIYKSVTTSSVSTVLFADASTFLIYTTESPSSTVESITAPIVYRSPTTESNGNGKSEYLLFFILLVIALCLVFFVIFIVYCYFCYYKRFSPSSVRMSDISRNNQEVVPVQLNQTRSFSLVEIEPDRNFNRKSVAETLYFTIPSTVNTIPEISEILTNDFSCSDSEENPELTLKKNQTFIILD